MVVLFLRQLELDELIPNIPRSRSGRAERRRAQRAFQSGWPTISRPIDATQHRRRGGRRGGSNCRDRCCRRDHDFLQSRRRNASIEHRFCRNASAVTASAAAPHRPTGGHIPVGCTDATFVDSGRIRSALHVVSVGVYCGPTPPPLPQLWQSLLRQVQRQHGASAALRPRETRARLQSLLYVPRDAFHGDGSVALLVHRPFLISHFPFDCTNAQLMTPTPPPPHLTHLTRSNRQSTTLRISFPFFIFFYFFFLNHLSIIYRGGRLSISLDEAKVALYRIYSIL